ncbi:Hypothetical_protein [Hexamita inflata]|uniref:Hypothetical_protein n=1 Tax=Hexamita inflata TaxID=28002 RepID=A0AA86NUL4_9EUKA|nr:Hypothetical protein HINF_LOCUS14487 [Hexamita inflata]CAI9960070.1 Hypothetical protein HINF_LOCUS47715 [Hexamita inflata]
MKNKFSINEQKDAATIQQMEKRAKQFNIKKDDEVRTILSRASNANQLYRYEVKSMMRKLFSTEPVSLPKSCLYYQPQNKVSQIYFLGEQNSDNLQRQKKQGNTFERYMEQLTQSPRIKQSQSYQNGHKAKETFFEGTLNNSSSSVTELMSPNVMKYGFVRKSVSGLRQQKTVNDSFQK